MQGWFQGIEQQKVLRKLDYAYASAMESQFAQSSFSKAVVAVVLLVLILVAVIVVG
jgi:hypothetical protein